MKERVGIAVCPTCGSNAPQDYRAKRVQAHVDGEHSGYYAEETGFPVDPQNPLKRICPAKAKAKDAFKRLGETTQGGMVYE
jgi:hypothetical protein